MTRGCGLRQNYLLGKRVDAIEVVNSTLGHLVEHMSAQTYTATVLMRNNGISALHADAFRGSDHNIGRLDLSSNQLSSVNFSMFNSFMQMQVLNLGGNELTSVRDAGRAPSLRVLYLYSNRIESIDADAFFRLEALEYLDLRFNNLQVLEPAALQVRSSRWQLRIRSNQLATVEDAFGQSTGFLPPTPFEELIIDLSCRSIPIPHRFVRQQSHDLALPSLWPYY